MPTNPREPGAAPLILAPGGDEECVKAALAAGADAVYLGLPRFNARMRAANVSETALGDLIRLAHHRSAKIYLAMNTLLTEGELPEAVATAERCLERGTDAVIVQDWGLLTLLGELMERRGFAAELHASTQMTTHNRAQLEVLADLGVRQVILARELELSELRALSARARELGMRTEVFVHGAYCLSVSGQCSMSFALAGRSGNRGECAQPCRRRYRSAGWGYPLSLKDCSLFGGLAELVAAGVGGLKIEGRMKGADYVYTVVRAYRRELDRVLGGERPAGEDPSLALVFNRGFHDGYLRGQLTAEMFGGEPFDKALSPVGRVRSFGADLGLLRLAEVADLGEGDLLSILTQDRAVLVCKARVRRVATGDSFEVGMEGELKGKIVRGCLVFRHPRLPDFERALAEIRGMEAQPLCLDARLEGREGGFLGLEILAPGRTIHVESEVPLRRADRRPLDERVLRDALGRLGGTGYVLRALDLSGLEQGLFIPVSRLNEMRRRAMEQVRAREPTPSPPATYRPAPRLPFPLPRLAVILSDPGQAEAFRARGALAIVEVTDAAAAFDPGACLPYLPSVAFDHQLEGYRAVLSRPGVRAVVSDNTGLGRECARLGLPWIAGPHTNVTNAASAEALRRAASASAFFHSPELDTERIRSEPVVEGMPDLLMVAGPMLLMTTRQCIIRNLEPCAAAVTDRGCVSSCRRSAVMWDEGGRPFHVEKRPGMHTEIYNGSVLWYPRAVRELRDRVCCYVLDLRDLSFLRLTLEAKMRMLDRCEQALTGGGDEGPLPELSGRATRGGFARTL